jgi:hypothetical protein
MNGGIRLNASEVKAVAKASTMEELAEVAIRFLRRISKKGHEVIEICGPMTTGGLGDFNANMKRYNHAIKMAVQSGYVVFDLPFFQPAIVRILDFKEGQPNYNWEILHVFLRKVFESRYIVKGFFLPDWQSSIGASWEREEFERLKIPIEECPSTWLDQRPS